MFSRLETTLKFIDCQTILKINLTPLCSEFPVMIEQERYDELIKRKTKSWSICENEIEWLAKLHYLKTGFEEGKINREKFAELEERLVFNWWKTWL